MFCPNKCFLYFDFSKAFKTLLSFYSKILVLINLNYLFSSILYNKSPPTFIILNIVF